MVDEVPDPTAEERNRLAGPLFLQVLGPGGGEQRLGELVPRRAREEDERERRVELPDLGEEFHAVALRHGVLAHDAVDVRQLAGRGRRRAPVPEFDPVGVPEVLFEEREVVGLVVDEQHRDRFARVVSGEGFRLRPGTHDSVHGPTLFESGGSTRVARVLPVWPPVVGA